MGVDLLCSAPGGDPDRDGIPTLEEVIAGTDPQVFTQVGGGEAPDAATILFAAFADLDVNGDGQLSYMEAEAALSELTRGQFDALDLNRDGRIEISELEEESAPVGCQAAKFVRGYLGDLFLLGLTLTTLMSVGLAWRAP